MEPIRYVDALNEKYGAVGFPPYKWSVHDTAPWTPLTKPLADCTVAMLVSGGISHCSAMPFDPDARNDHRVDAIDPHAAIDDRARPVVVAHRDRQFEPAHETVPSLPAVIRMYRSHQG